MSKNTPVVKLPPDGSTISMFVESMTSKGIAVGDKFILKFKKGCRWKLKKFHLIAFGTNFCGDCGGYNELTIKKGDKYIDFDNHLGVAWVDGNYIFEKIS